MVQKELERLPVAAAPRSHLLLLAAVPLPASEARAAA
jgi:hypothetical protein